MKTISRVFVLLVLFSLSSQSMATTTSNAVKKAQEAVSESPYDWKILAESAVICFKKGENIDEAMKWINKSIEINKDPMNLEIKADYLVEQGKKKEASKFYIEAINTAKNQNFWYDTSDLQQKLWKLR